jgi:hypothetical protein
MQQNAWQKFLDNFYKQKKSVDGGYTYKQAMSDAAKSYKIAGGESKMGMSHMSPAKIAGGESEPKMGMSPMSPAKIAGGESNMGSMDPTKITGGYEAKTGMDIGSMDPTAGGKSKKSKKSKKTKKTKKTKKNNSKKSKKN